MLLFPLPFGPVTTVSPLSKGTEIFLSPKDLKPLISKRLMKTNIMSPKFLEGNMYQYHMLKAL
jgi:hypothetical protein